jgi:hypothetical protein
MDFKNPKEFTDFKKEPVKNRWILGGSQKLYLSHFSAQKREVKNVGGSQEQMHLNLLFGPVTVCLLCPT